MSIRLFFALLALLALATAAPVAAAAPSKGQGACKRTSDVQTRKVDFRYLFQETLQKKGKRKDGTPWPIKVLREERGSLGSMTFRATTCKTPKGGWKLLKPQGLGFKSSGARTDQGGVDNGKWRIGLADAREDALSFLSFRMLSCSETGLSKGIVLLVGLVPLGRLSFVRGIAKWGVGKVLPDDKLKCGDYGTVDMNIDADANGNVAIGPNTANTRSNSYVRPNKYFKRAWTYSITDPIVS